VGFTETSLFFELSLRSMSALTRVRAFLRGTVQCSYFDRGSIAAGRPPFFTARCSRSNQRRSLASII
jgi:hypothetical protein